MQLRYAALFLLLFAGMASANDIKRILYGAPATVDFNIYGTDGSFDVDEADGGAEITLHCDDDAGTNPITNDFVDEGSYYTIALTASETQCARIVLDINATQQELVHIETFGDLNAQDTSRGTASGVAQSATATTIVLASATSIADDYLNGALISIEGGTGAGQTNLITDWVSSTDTATVANDWVTNPSSDSVYRVHQTRFANVEVDSVTGYMSSDVKQAEGVDWSDQVDTRLTSNTVNATVTGMSTDVLDAAALNADAVTEINAAQEQANNRDATALNCEVNTANFAGSTTTLACILTDRDDGAVTAASGDLEGKALLVLSGAQIYESRFITDTTWDAGNSELQLTLSRALPATLADAVTAQVY